MPTRRIHVAGGKNGAQLSRFHLFPSKLHFHGVESPSIEGIFNYALLNQSGRRDLGDDLLRRNDLMYHPERIRPWIESQHVDISVDFTLNSAFVYQDIMSELYYQPDSPFRAAFLEAIAGVRKANKLRFIVYSGKKEMVLSVGCNYDEFVEGDPCNGLNFYGKFLEDLARAHLSGKQLSEPWFNGESLCYGDCLKRSRYRYTVLVISDSQCQNFKHVQCGKVISVSGGRYADIAEQLDYERRVNGIYLCDYNYIIVNVGINVVQIPEQMNDIRYLEPLGEMLITEARRRANTEIIFSTPFQYPWMDNFERHIQDVEHYFRHEKIHVVNWFREGNPFVDDYGELIQAYFDKDDIERFGYCFHISHRGFRNHWLVWCRKLPDLVGLTYNLSKASKAVLSLRTKRKRKTAPTQRYIPSKRQFHDP